MSVGAALMTLPDVDPELLEPHLSNRVMAAVIAELDAAVDSGTVDAALAEVGVPRRYATDPEHWVSMEFVRRFARDLAHRLYQLEELPPHDHEMWQHWRHAARRALRPEVIGPIYRVLRAFGSPSRFYSQVPALHGRASRKTKSELRSMSKGHAVLSVRPRGEHGALESPNCWFQRGLFEAIPTLWGHPPATVEHRQCMLDAKRPAKACVYRIQFEDRRATLGLSSAAWIACGGVVGTVLGLVAGLGPILPAITGAAIGAAIDGWRHRIRVDRFAGREVDDLSRLLQEADEHQAELWEEHVALRRSMLVARKLSGYLASDLTERIVQHPELQLTLGGRHTDAAVLFVDIVGFTPRCESMDPAQLVEELNVYFGHIDPNVAEHHGVIDKRIGDGIMAVFVPRDGIVDHVAVRALRCAMGMLRSLETCNAELATRGAQPFQIRIGVAAGGLIQGNMGSEIQLEYTVIGDVVNLAARLEHAATRGNALVPTEILEQLPDTERAELREGEPRSIEVKGRTGVFDVVDVRPKSQQRGT